MSGYRFHDEAEAARLAAIAETEGTRHARPSSHDSEPPPDFDERASPRGNSQTARPWTFAGTPPNLSYWLNRELPEIDHLLGELMSTTSRVLLIGPTGLGKTNFCLALAAHLAAGRNFLH
jgi:AAA domain